MLNYTEAGDLNHKIYKGGLVPQAHRKSWFVIKEFIKPNGGAYRCGGSLISRRYQKKFIYVVYMFDVNHPMH